MGECGNSLYPERLISVCDAERGLPQVVELIIQVRLAMKKASEEQSSEALFRTRALYPCLVALNCLSRMDAAYAGVNMGWWDEEDRIRAAGLVLPQTGTPIEAKFLLEFLLFTYEKLKKFEL